MKQNLRPLKNPNGFGTVYKLPGRRRRPWVARVTTGWKKAIAKKGKRAGKEVPRQIYHIVGCFGTKREALEALALYKANPAPPKSDITLAELYNDWSENKYKNISTDTVNNYKAAWKYIDKIGSARVADIKTSHWQSVVNNVVEQGLGKSSLQKIRSLAVMLSDHAMKDDIISKNYASLVDMPKFEKIERDRFSDLEVKEIEKQAAKGTLWADVILILIYTGFRISELLALTRFNIDLKDQIITGGMKTEAGKGREIPINPKILKHVKAWHDKSGDRLICKENGSRWTSDSFRRKCYWPAIEAIGIRKLVPHSCRHTFATMLAEAGVDPLYIKELLGHTQYAFTADNYTHPSRDKLRQAIDKI